VIYITSLKFLLAGREFLRSAIATACATFGRGRTSRWDVITEVTERLSRGEPVDREAYLTRYPRHAQLLREFFRSWDTVDSHRGALHRARMQRVNEKCQGSEQPSLTTVEILVEIMERSARGEHIAPEVYLARFPEHADLLREFFSRFEASCTGCVASDQLLAQEVCEVLRRAQQVAEVLPLLPEKDCQVIRMVHLEHRSMDEVTAEMGLSRDAAGRRLARAQHRFNTKLAHGSRDHVR